MARRFVRRRSKRGRSIPRRSTIPAFGAIARSGRFRRSESRSPAIWSPALGDRVAVELATGQRAAGKIAWSDRGELGVRFEESIDVIALLNRKLVSQTPERRTMPRLEVRALRTSNPARISGRRCCATSRAVACSLRARKCPR